MVADPALSPDRRHHVRANRDGQRRGPEVQQYLLQLFFIFLLMDGMKDLVLHKKSKSIARRYGLFLSIGGKFLKRQANAANYQQTIRG